MNWLVMYFALQAGLIYQQAAILQDGTESTWQTPTNSSEITLSAGATILDHLHISGFTRSYQTLGAQSAPDILPVDFAPYRIDYGIKAYASFSILDIGVQHECDHFVGQLGRPYAPSSIFGGGATEFFFQIHTSTTLR